MSSQLREIMRAFGTIVRETRKSSALSSLLLLILVVALLFATAMVTQNIAAQVFLGALLLAVVGFSLWQYDLLRRQDPDLLRSETHVENKLAISHHIARDQRGRIAQHDDDILIERTDEQEHALRRTDGE